MSRVKFNVNSEYAYIQNFKILQSEFICHRHSVVLESLIAKPMSDCFGKHNLERTVPVESLIKCKMQDNLEFLQWTKRHWDQYFSGNEYDAISRRKGSGAPVATQPPAGRTSVGGAPRKPANTGAARVAPKVGLASAGGASAVAMRQENETLKDAIAGLEKERDFYFSKLRDIELLLQNAVESNPEVEESNDGLVKSIQTILYSTEEGFEIPAEADGENGEEPETF